MSQQDAKELVIERGDGASPEVFTFVCGIRSKTFTMANASIDTTVPNCDDPSAPIVATARPGRQTLTFQGDGLFDNAEVGKDVFDDARLQRETNYRITIPGVGSFDGPFFVSDYSNSGDMEDPLAFSATWIPLDASQLTFTPAA